jgi:GNAT superfamily N-acetyltransferase
VTTTEKIDDLRSNTKGSTPVVAVMPDKSISSQVLIRPWNTDDSVDTLTQILHRAFAQGPGQPYPYPVARQDAQATREQIRQGKCWIAEIDGRLVGVGIVWPPTACSWRALCNARNGAHLRQLAVEPQFQGMGIGGRLLEACELGALAMNAPTLWGSSPVGARQLSLYRRHGYRIVEYKRWPNTDYESVIFAKRLPTTTRRRFSADLVRGMLSWRNLALHWWRQWGGAAGIPKAVARRLLKGFARVVRRVQFLWCHPRSRNILLCCNAPLMADYLGPFRELFADDPRLRFYLALTGLFSSGSTDKDRRTIRQHLGIPEVSRCRICATVWDLVVFADHSLERSMAGFPAIYIGHGPKCKVMPGDYGEYTYGRFAFDMQNRPLYRRMFEEREADRDQVVQANPSLKDVIAVVGSLENDRLLEQAHHREEFRQRLGFGPQDVVVLVLSTWGEHCLFCMMGDQILAEAHRLLPQFKFILSVHPNEYRPKPDGERVWGEYLRSQRQYGFVVREPSESWIPHLVACDVVLSDYTGLVDYAVLLEKPIILTPVPEQTIWKDSVIWKLRQFAPVLNDARRLREYLVRAREDYPRAKLHELARTVHPHRGEAVERIRREIYALLRLPPPG